MRAGTVPLGPSLRASLDLIGQRARRRYIVVVMAQMATSLLDLAGVLLIGMTVVFAYSVPAGVEVPATVQTAIDTLGLEDVPLTTLAVACGLIAAALLLTKSAVSAIMLQRIFRFLARRQAQVASQLSRGWFGADVRAVHSRTDIEIEQAVTTSAYFATTGLLGSLAVVATELSLLVVLSVALVFVDPVATLLAAACFVVVSVVVHRALSGWAGRLGRELTERSVAGRADVRQAMDSFRELRTARRLGYPLERFEGNVERISSNNANLLFINNVPKIAYEAALVVGALLLVGWRVVTGDVAEALAFLAVFLTAAARLLPSMVRLQGQLVSMRAAAGQARLTFELADEERERGAPPSLDDLGRRLPLSGDETADFDPTVEVTDVTVTYRGNVEPTLQNVTLRIAAGESLVLVGPTGVGKSTLVDVILGATEPESGSVRIGGLDPRECQERWPGAIAYMPQDCPIWSGTVRDNVALGIPADQIDEDAVWRALEQAHLASDVRERGGIDAQVGQAGRQLSGGQRQRLGIARALYSQPRLLVLDEATSALDEETEALIGGVIEELRGTVTVIAVAHRRSTIERASVVAALADGRVSYVGVPSGYATGPT